MSQDWRRKHWRALALFSGILASGCQSETVLGSSQQVWLWGLIPVAGLALIGSFYAWQRRVRQIEGWNLLEDPEEPTTGPIVRGLLLGAAIPAAVFIIENIRVEIDDRQRLINIGLWLLSSIAGGAVALLVGLKVAERDLER